MTESPNLARRVVLSRADRVSVVITTVVAAAAALLVAANSILTAVGFFLAGGHTLTLWADEPLDAREPVTSAVATQVEVTTSALDAGARWAFAAGHLVIAVTVLGVGALVVRMLIAVAAGGFARSLFGFAVGAGLTLVIGPLAGGALLGLGTLQAAIQLGDVVEAGIYPGFEVSGAAIGWPVAGFAVLAVSYLLRHGDVLQRDTAGLV